MSTEPKRDELLPLNIIRTETALCRYPIHRLAKKGSLEIEIREKNENSETTFRWEVDYSKKRGQPGPLAYKVDTLIINRRVEEAQPLPKIVKLGSLNELAEELGSNKAQIKKALYQNAAAFITAKMRYKGKDGVERTTEFGDTRYGVVFTGEKLPDGREADAIYIVLHDWYKEILETTQTRPLDYDYLKDLSPAAQRLYELLSFQMYGSLKHERPRAKLLYSDFCTFAPQTRYYDYRRIKKQMYKLHLPHKKSGYIASVEFRETTDSEGQADWEILYTPGRKAKAEFRAFNSPGGTVGEKRQKLRLPKPPATEQELLPEVKSSHQTALTHEPLIEQLKEFGITEQKANDLISTKRNAVEQQLAAYPYRVVSEKRKNLAGWLIAAIENDYELPKAYTDAQAKGAEVRRAKVKRIAVETCGMCDSSGFRVIRTADGRSAAKKCSHNPELEAQHESF